jgi:8-oxo-dGTP pyrophosphatase MutT (NUDIX family)
MSLSKTPNDYADCKAQALVQRDRYLKRYPEEAEGLKALGLQLKGGGDIFARANMEGHITTSALVLDPAETSMLLIHHIHHGGWFQPGGHFDGGEPLIDSAIREVLEETGVETVADPSFNYPVIPIDIETHPISARPQKGEGAHFHHDYIYVLTAKRGFETLSPQLEEVHGAKWMKLADLDQLGNPRIIRMRAKLAEFGYGR